LRALLLKGIFWRGIYFISLFVLNLLMSRHYQATDSGSIFYNLTLLAWLTLALSFCLEFGMNYYLASGKISAPALNGFAIIWTIGASIISYFVLMLFGIKINLDGFNLPFVNFSVIYISGNLLISYYSAFFYALKKFIIPNLVPLICNLILIYIILKQSTRDPLHDQFIHLYYISFLVQGLTLFIIFIVGSLSGFKIELPARGDVKMLLKTSVWAFFTNGLTLVLYRLDYWFVNHYCSPENLGNYIQASKIGQVFLVIPTIISTTSFPIIASGMLTSPVNNIQSLIRSLLLFSSIPAIFLILTGRWLFPYLLGNSFEFMYGPFVLLIPGLLAFSVICPITAYFGGRKILHVNFISNIIAVFVVAGLDYLTIPRFGIMAAAIVSSCGYLIYSACLVWFFDKYHSIRLASFFAVRSSDFYWVKKFFEKKGNRS
jgi:O-antigen/teichoic acid export membrane protein